MATIYQQYKANRAPRNTIEGGQFIPSASLALSWVRQQIEHDEISAQFALVDNVRIDVQIDDCLYDDSYIDTWTDLSDEQRETMRAELWDRIQNDGVWGIVGQYFDGDEWIDVDAVWGFVGDDWRGPGYETDVMRATLDAYSAFMAHREFMYRPA